MMLCYEDMWRDDEEINFMYSRSCLRILLGWVTLKYILVGKVGIPYFAGFAAHAVTVGLGQVGLCEGMGMDRLLSRR